MEPTALKTNLEYLVLKYLSESPKRAEILVEIHLEGIPPVKGIMADLAETGASFDECDQDLIKDIAYNYL